jgi:hypothetical protein
MAVLAVSRTPTDEVLLVPENKLLSCTKDSKEGREHGNEHG